MDPLALAPGSLLAGRYEIAREIGRGGYSIVYQARDRSVGADVAIKLLVPPPVVAQLARERMRREVQAVRELSHENIVAVYDLLEEETRSCIVMEYVPGPDLQARVVTGGALTVPQLESVGKGIAAALAAAHRHGILHRDVKPQNILLAPDGRARLTDFGSARLDGQATVTQTGGLVGTLAYTAPEVLAGQRGDARADLYSFGMTLYFAATGALPPGTSRHLPPPAAPEGHRARVARRDIPEWLDGIIARATAADPRDRFPGAAAFLTALEQRSSQTMPARKGGDAAGESCVMCGGLDDSRIGVCAQCRAPRRHRRTRSYSSGGAPVASSGRAPVPCWRRRSMVRRTASCARRWRGSARWRACRRRPPPMWWSDSSGAACRRAPSRSSASGRRFRSRSTRCSLWCSASDAPPPWSPPCSR